MDKLSHLIYRSRATKIFSDKELVDMLVVFRKKNESLGVTGMLLYDAHAFFQVIEGDDSALSQLYDSIKKDSRHTMVKTIVNEQMHARAFSNWRMGFSKVNNQMLNNIQGMNNVFTNKSIFDDVDSGIAKKLLEYFAAKQALQR